MAGCCVDGLTAWTENLGGLYLYGFVKDKLYNMWQRAFYGVLTVVLDPCQAHHYSRCARLSCRHTLLSDPYPFP